MIIEPIFELFSDNFNFISISKWMAVKENGGQIFPKKIAIFHFIFLGIGVRIIMDKRNVI